MTTPGGPQPAKNNWFAIGASGTARAKLENRSQSVMEGLLKTDQKPGIDSAFSGFNGGLIGMLTRVLTGVGGGILAPGLSFLASLFNIRWAQVDSHDGEIQSISMEQQEANSRLDALESFAGTGVTTPLATSIGGRDIVTFPDSLMMRFSYQDKDTK